MIGQILISCIGNTNDRLIEKKEIKTKKRNNKEKIFNFVFMIMGYNTDD